ETGAWVTPFAIDPNTNTTIYVGMKNVWKSTNRGDSWTKISPWSTSTTLRSLAVAPSNSDYIYAATQSSFYRTIDGGSNWSSDISGTLPTGSGSITYISINNNDPLTVWVSLGGYNSYGVYESTNGGDTWTNISTGLPSLPLMCVIQNRQNTNQVELYAGTDVGVYVKAGAADWTLFFDGLPNVVVTELDIYYDDITPANSSIRAATYGRGLWESDLFTATAPTCYFTADNVFPADDSEYVSFTDKSTNSPTSWEWTITPATITYQSSTSSTSENPVVSFTNNGPYTISLTVTNAYGSDTETKTDYIHQGQQGKWTGTTNTEWNTETNWENQMVPTSSTDITISATAINWLSYTGNFELGVQCNNFSMDGASEVSISGNLTIASGKSFVCNGANTVKVGGNWDNNGTFTAGTGTVNLYGSNASNITTVGSATGGGKIDNSGGGGYYTSATYNIFNCVTAFQLVSAKVYASGAGERTFYWANSSGTVQEQTVVNLPDGESRVTLNFNITTGTDHRLGVSSSSPNLYRNNSGVSYPYAIGALGSVVSSNAGTSYYYFCYDIEYSTGSGVETYNNLVISKSNNTVTTNGDIDINNNLTVQPGAWFTNATGNTIAVTNNLTLEANASGTASFIDNGTTNVTGSTDVQYYCVSDLWHYISSCFSTGNNFNVLFSGQVPTDFYRWDESHSEQGSTGWWINILHSSEWNNTTFAAAQGYAISDYTAKATTYTLSGVLYNTTKTLNMTKTTGSSGEGWNLVGNPFPGSMAANTNADANNFLSRNSEVLDPSYTAIYIYNDAIQDYVTVNNGSNAAYISSGQGFLVRTATDGNDISFHIDDRKHGTATFYKGGDETQRFSLTLTSPDNVINETEIVFMEGMGYGLDPSYDAGKYKGNPDLSLYTSLIESNGHDFAIQALPLLNEPVIVPIGLNAGIQGTYSFTAEMQNFEPNTPITLVDKYTSNQVDLVSNPQYNFLVDEPGTYNNRFLIYFKSAVGIEENGTQADDAFEIYAYGNQIFISSSPKIEEYSVKVYNAVGQLILQKEFNYSPFEQINIDQPGTYIVRVFADHGVATKKVVVQ
ncbi:MAG: hypothetical protein B6I19_10035, partial [Bacteroidetes bacterium 4572_114]